MAKVVEVVKLVSGQSGHLWSKWSFVVRVVKSGQSGQEWSRVVKTNLTVYGPIAYITRGILVYSLYLILLMCH